MSQLGLKTPVSKTHEDEEPWDGMSGLYVIRRSDGKYVTPPGKEHSYTARLQDAWFFGTRAEAEGELCQGNEHVEEVKPS
jgi:hypothetical protein